VRRIAVLLLLVSACRTVAVVPDNSMPGAATPRAAVDRFLAASKAQDMQALGAVWGDEKGALRDRTDRAQMEKRELIMLQCLRHDQAVVSSPVRGAGGHQVFSVDLTQAKLTATSAFTVARGPSDRWYVADFDIVALQNKGFCSRPGG
jgi:hypothetical protein